MTTSLSPSVRPTSGAYRGIMLYDSAAPQPVVASVVTAVLDEYGDGPADYIEFIVTCASPCPSDFPEQTVTQPRRLFVGRTARRFEHHDVLGLPPGDNGQ